MNFKWLKIKPITFRHQETIRGYGGNLHDTLVGDV